MGEMPYATGGNAEQWDQHETDEAWQAFYEARLAGATEWVAVGRAIAASGRLTRVEAAVDPEVQRMVAINAVRHSRSWEAGRLNGGPYYSVTFSGPEIKADTTYALVPLLPVEPSEEG